MSDNNKTIVFTGGTILTMSETMYVEAIAVKDKKIICVGTLEQCKQKASNDFNVVDLKGQCLLPGFIDPHVHVMMLGMCNTWADISFEKAKNIEGVISILRDYGKDLPTEIPIRGFGFDQRKLTEGRYPTASDLDQVAVDRPVQIMNSSGHCNVVNNHLLTQMGIHDKTLDPIGGALGRDKYGKPNGPLFDSANDYLAQQLGVRPGNHGPNIHMPDTKENLQKYVAVGQEILLSAGFSTVNDVQVSKQEMESYLIARDSGLLKLRIQLTFLSNYLTSIKELGINSSFGDDILSLGSLKLYADGSLISGTAYVAGGYSDSDRKKGYLYHKEEEFMSILIDAHKFGLQTLTHAQGNGAIELVLRAVEEAQRICPRQDMRHRIEHCGLPTRKQVKKMKELGIWPIPQPQHVYLFGNGVLQSLGSEGENYSPYGWFKQHDIPLVLSSDTPVAFPNAFEAIYAAVTRQTLQGNVIGATHKITLEEALKGYTIEAAKSMHKEHLVGSIETGKLADFVIISSNPFSLEEHQLLDIAINETWISGKRVFRKQKLLSY